MSLAETPKSAGLVARVQAILLRPAAEWDVIDAESASTQSLFAGYACILAAIGPVALIVSHLLFIHWTIVPIVVIAVLTYLASLAGAFIVGFIINALAPSFGGQQNQIQAMKLSVYSYTAAWVAGVFNLIPLLAILALLAALYGLYILYLGLPKLMKSPPDKTVGYFVATLLVAIVVNVIIGWVIFLVTVSLTIGALVSGASTYSSIAGPMSGAVHVNGAQVDLGKVQSAAAAMAASAQAMRLGQANGKVVAAVDPETLKNLLPDSVAGMPRTDVTAESVGAGGMASSHAEAVYSKGDERLTLKVTDLAAMGAMAAMAGAVNLQSSRQTATGYEKTSTVNGRLTVEKWDSATKSGEYSVIVASRFAVEADGAAPSMDDLKSAVAAVGPDRLEGMAKA